MPARIRCPKKWVPSIAINLAIVMAMTWMSAAQSEQTASGTIPPAPSGTSLAAISASHVCTSCIRAHMEFLASDALEGRGSGTRDEWIAATYIASELQRYGIEPAGDDGTFLQRVALVRRKLNAPPKLTVRTTGKPSRSFIWTHGKQILVVYLGALTFSGPLQKIDVANNERPPIKRGAVLLLSGPQAKVRDAAYEFGGRGVSAVLVPESSRLHPHWKERGTKLPEQPIHVEGVEDSAMRPEYPVIVIKDEYLPILDRVREGAVISMKGSARAAEKHYTWNAVGRIPGSDASQQHATILLTAHLDHLGIGKPINGDNIYNGADDDASGVVAVLELARVLASQPRPRRTITFALFGSEELGGLGSSYFRAHPPVALQDIAAYLEFEMIGRADPAVPNGTLWLTGWDRTNLGPALVEHGAKLVADPHPDQDFFRRSDNYVFAKAGVVAQTVSSYGLHEDYHQPTDDTAHIDFKHMDQAIESLFEPVQWLINSDFVPHWNAGKQP
jgi:aminopeptidase YwaD